MASISQPPLAEALPEGLCELLARLGISAGDASCTLCQGGGNNQVFEVRAPDRRLIAKKYYRSALDPRDRLDAEWRFLGYARTLGLSTVPRPLGCDEASALALYEFIEGRALQPGEAGRTLVDRAAAFFRALNGDERQALGAFLPEASEARFSVAEQLRLVDQRIRRLNEIGTASAVDRDATVLTGRLDRRWSDIRARIAAAAERLPTGAAGFLPPERRCISPSDFGFHNALLRPNGELCFIDFEYAGWDDPAKMAADFFCQPQIPVDMDHFDFFLDRTVTILPAAEELVERARALLPAFRVKWACIMLNDFSPDAARRRRFADPGIDIDARKRAQLAKVEHMLRLLEH